MQKLRMLMAEEESRPAEDEAEEFVLSDRWVFFEGEDVGVVEAVDGC